MCMTAIEKLTLAGLLADPLTRLVMHSDGVSEQDFADLWLRIQGLVRRDGADVTMGVSPTAELVPA